MVAEKFAHRTKLILAGLYLSKFDSQGLALLGFSSFTEAFNVLGLALSGRPASIKNYRDEFDPIFPNKRQGWHKRQLRAHCQEILNKYGSFGATEFTSLIKEVIYKNGELDILIEELGDAFEPQASTFAKRLITGQAAEQYFKTHYKSIIPFQGFEFEDTTRLGCGFDFKLTSPSQYFAVEVKGMNEASGSVMLTNKEHAVAATLKERYFMFVVKNFREKPFHDIYRDPLSSSLAFTRVEVPAITVSWRTSV